MFCWIRGLLLSFARYLFANSFSVSAIIVAFWSSLIFSLILLRKGRIVSSSDWISSSFIIAKFLTRARASRIVFRNLCLTAGFALIAAIASGVFIANACILSSLIKYFISVDNLLTIPSIYSAVVWITSFTLACTDGAEPVICLSCKNLRALAASISPSDFLRENIVAMACTPNTVESGVSFISVTEECITSTFSS